MSSPQSEGVRQQVEEQEHGQDQKRTCADVSVLLLGAAQDGGFPQFGCSCSQCSRVFCGELEADSAVSLAVLDHRERRYWLFDSSMQLSEQWRKFGGLLNQYTLAGIFLTHAHVGHYIGLLYVGKECCNSRELPLYASRDMHSFLQSNQPFGVLYANHNVTPVPLSPEQSVQLSSRLSVTAHAVQHRADFTDTLAFTISGPSRSLFFCPDIDSWAGLAPLYTLQQLLTQRDLLLLDATFYDNLELPQGRDMSTIPHPRVVDTIKAVREARESSEISHSNFGEVVLIHLNHSNRLWHKDRTSEEEKVMSTLHIIVGRTGHVWEL